MARTAPSGDIATSAPWLTAALGPSRDKRLGDCRLGFGLQARIERRLDGEVTTAGAGKIAQLLGDPVAEIAGTRSRAGNDGERRPLLGGGGGLGFGDHARLDHVGEDLSRPRRGLVAVAGRVEPRRRLQEAGDGSALIEGGAPRRLAEITVRRGIDAIGAGAEIDAIEIDLEDLVLGEAMFEPECQQSLPDLASRGCAPASETGSWRAAGLSCCRPGPHGRPRRSATEARKSPIGSIPKWL